MKKVTEARNTIDTMSEIIRFQSYEIDFLRNLVARYYDEYDPYLHDKKIDIKENETFTLVVSEKKIKYIKCVKVNNEALGVKSRYQRIQEMIKTLEL
jgi:hypothetical protein